MLFILRRNLAALLHQNRLVLTLFCVSLFLSFLTILYTFGEANSFILYDYLPGPERTAHAFHVAPPSGTCMLSDARAAAEQASGIEGIDNALFSLSDGETIAFLHDYDYIVQFGSGFTDPAAHQVIIGAELLPFAEIGETVRICGSDYVIVGKRSGAGFHEVPLASLPETEPVLETAVFTDRILSERKQQRIAAALSGLFAGQTVTMPRGTDLLSKYLGENHFRIVLALSLIALLNLSYLYRYLLRCRKNAYAVYRICGCTKLYGVCLFLAELLVLSVPVFLAAAAVYIWSE